MSQKLLVRNTIGLFAIVTFIFVAFTQRHYPEPSCDEVAYSAAAQGWLNTGTPSWEPMMSLGDPYGRDTNLGFQGRAYLGLLASNFSVFGASLDTARIVSVLGWVVSTGLTFLLGQALFTTQIGSLSALMFAVYPKTFFTAHFARPESWTIAAVLAACVYTVRYTTQSNHQRWQAFLLGAVLILPGFFHGNGFIFSAVLIGYVSLELLRNKNFKAFSQVIAGSVVAALLWVVAHLGFTASALQQALWYTTFASASTDLSTETSFWSGLATLPSWLRTTYWSGGSQLEALLFGIASITLVLNRNRRGLALLGLIATTLLLFGLFFSQRFFQYSALWAPFVAIVTVAGIAHIVTLIRRAIPIWTSLQAETLIAVCMLTICSGYLAIDAIFTLRNMDGNYAETAQAVADLVPADSTVLADATWWWVLNTEHTFLTDEYLFMLPNTVDQRVQDFLDVDATASTTDAASALFTTLQPDYVILDSASGCNMGATADWEAAHALVTHTCETVGTVPGSWINDPRKVTSQFGQTSTVYRCDWTTQ